tara:strand:+ start:1179 stop:1793 length:615 start_codon:yes stop_codon:yes gene_type:complete
MNRKKNNPDSFYHESYTPSVSLQVPIDQTNIRESAQLYRDDEEIKYDGQENNKSETNEKINNNDSESKIIDNILLNLKMISLVKANDKLYMEEDKMKIDTPKLTQGFLRWINDYSRTKTMEDIETLINNTSSYVKNNKSKPNRTEEDNRNCQKILVEISKSLTGIQNLKITYNEDTFIQSKLEVISEKISEIKNDLSRNLQVKS